MNEYLQKQKEVIKNMVDNYKDYEYNSYCFEINKLILRLNNSREFKIGDIPCCVIDNQLFIKFDLKSDFRDMKYTINNIKFLAKELNDVCVERGLL